MPDARSSARASLRRLPSRREREVIRLDVVEALLDRRGYCPDLVIVMNPIYLGEIGAQLEGMGIDAKLVAA